MSSRGLFIETEKLTFIRPLFVSIFALLTLMRVILVALVLIPEI